MRTVQWDKVISSSPLNTDAAIARDGRGCADPFEHYKNEYSPDGPPPLKSLNKYRSMPSFTDFTGLKVGRLIVLGLIDKSVAGLRSDKEKGNGRWSVRCVCGAYESRQTRAIKNHMKDAKSAMCRRCFMTARALSGDSTE